MAHYTPESYTESLIETLRKLDFTQVNKLTQAFLKARENGNSIFTFGNGGSGATASHAAGDFLKGASYGLEKRFRMICLNDNLPSMMAIANDIGYEDIFIEPLKNFIEVGDVAIGISGSGNSENVVKAMKYAKEKGALTVAMCGFKGGKISEMADIVLHADVMDMEVTEDVHMAIFNMVKKSVMQELLGENPSMGKVYDQRTP
jgi:D-sedoheptulose 7-phosphate isomerase